MKGRFKFDLLINGMTLTVTVDRLVRRLKVFLVVQRFGFYDDAIHFVVRLDDVVEEKCTNICYF